MRRWVLAVMVLLMGAGGASATIYHADGSGSFRWSDFTSPYMGTIYTGEYYTYYASFSVTLSEFRYCNNIDALIMRGDSATTEDVIDGTWSCDSESGCTFSVSGSYSDVRTLGTVTSVAAIMQANGLQSQNTPPYNQNNYVWSHTLITSDATYTVSGSIGCIDTIDLYIDDGGWINLVSDNVTGDSSYSYNISNGYDYRIAFDGAYYDFTCDGNEVFNYDLCLHVYGYTCGIEHIKLWKDDGGWVLEDTYYHGTIGVNTYEMQIESGNDYKLNFSDGHEYLFSCTGDHVLYDWDRCPWVYPPSPWVDPVPIIIYVGYDNRIVLLQDAHGNFIEHSQIAVYDQTDDVYLQKWTDNPEGYLVLAARYDTDHDVQIAVKTFDSVHTTTTTYPMNGTAENLTWTNWTIPIMYNIQMEPVDAYNVPLFDVFCGLAEYTPINPLSFWGMDFNRGYVPVTNCSGFSRCDITAEKGGYVPYEVTGLNWTSRSATIKDYRHEIVMVKE